VDTGNPGEGKSGLAKEVHARRVHLPESEIMNVAGRFRRPAKYLRRRDSSDICTKMISDRLGMSASNLSSAERTGGRSCVRTTRGHSLLETVIDGPNRAMHAARTRGQSSACRDGASAGPDSTQSFSAVSRKQTSLTLMVLPISGAPQRELSRSGGKAMLQPDNSTRTVSYPRGVAISGKSASVESHPAARIRTTARTKSVRQVAMVCWTPQIG
jgi:hypothetical protein